MVREIWGTGQASEREHWSVAVSCSGPEVAESLATTLPACTSTVEGQEEQEEERKEERWAVEAQTLTLRASPYDQSRSQYQSE